MNLPSQNIQARYQILDWDSQWFDILIGRVNLFDIGVFNG